MAKEIDGFIHLWRDTGHRGRQEGLDSAPLPEVSVAPSPPGRQALVYLQPFVPREEAEGSHRVTHEEPVDGLLHQIVEGLQDPDGGQAAQGWAVLNQAGSLWRKGRGLSALPLLRPLSSTTLLMFTCLSTITMRNSI